MERRVSYGKMLLFLTRFLLTSRWFWQITSFSRRLTSVIRLKWFIFKKVCLQSTLELNFLIMDDSVHCALVDHDSRSDIWEFTWTSSPDLLVGRYTVNYISYNIKILNIWAVDKLFFKISHFNRILVPLVRHNVQCFVRIAMKRARIVSETAIF